MAGDWIKMRTDLYRDPKVCLVADALMDADGDLARYVSQNMQRDMTVTRNVMRNVTVGALVTVWGVMRLRGKRVGVDLVCSKASVSVLDDMAELPGFGAALASVGWVAETDEGLVFPRFFDDYNVDPTEKKAASAAERQRRYRERSKVKCDVNSGVTRDVTVTHREEKRREEITAIPLSLRAGAQAVEVIDPNTGEILAVTPAAPTIANLTAIQSSQMVMAVKALRKMGAIRFHPGDEALAALMAEGFTAEQVVRVAGEKALRDSGVMTDIEVNPEVPELLINGASQRDMGLTDKQHTDLRGEVSKISTAYIAAALRGRRDEAKREKPAARQHRKPSATDSFEGKKYAETPIDKLPPELRAALEASPYRG